MATKTALTKNKKMVTLPLAFRVPKWIHDAAKAEASNTGYSISFVVRRWIEDHLAGE